MLYRIDGGEVNQLQALLGVENDGGAKGAFKRIVDAEVKVY